MKKEIYTTNAKSLIVKTHIGEKKLKKGLKNYVVYIKHQHLLMN